MDKYIKMALDSGAFVAKIIDVGKIVTAYWVRTKCQYGCSRYGKCLTCPPYSPTPAYTQKMLDAYQISMILGYRSVEENGTEICKKTRETISSLEREIFLDGYYKAFGMGAGPCNLCTKCDVRNPCKYPDVARPSLEACGIDVFQSLRNAEIKIEVVRAYECPCSFYGMILIE